MPAGTNYCIPEGMLGLHIGNEAVRQFPGTNFVVFSLFNQFLHPNHPLGWIRRLQVFLDDAEVPSKDMFFVVRGQWISVEHMPTIVDIWWHMREEAKLYIARDPVDPGNHEVRCHFHISLQVHTDIIDRDDIWPTLEQVVSATLSSTETLEHCQ